MKAFVSKHADRAQFVVICLTIAGMAYAFLLFASTAHASVRARETHTATATGYAFGGTGAAGVQMQQWHFANHPPGTQCGGGTDPSGNWPWGTKITMDLPVVQHSSTNGAYNRYSFWLYDNGDPNCIKGMYWVDIHHGRYKDPPQNCSCPGTPNPSCLSGSNGVNNCTDATNFGSSTRCYVKW